MSSYKDFKCDECGAEPGKPCISRKKKPLHRIHNLRILACDDPTYQQIKAKRDAANENRD